MNATLPPTLARAMLAMAPPQSVVHQIVSEERAKRIDSAMLADKKAGAYERRNQLAALHAQIQSNPGQWL